MDKISIIVPVYNSAKFLNLCISSIIKQDYQNLEILMINDGSTDNSAEICKDFCQKDKRVRLINKPHGGIASARNLGLDILTGDLVMFVDGDDWLADDGIKRLYQAMEDSNADVIVGQYLEFNDESNNYLLHVFDKHSVQEDYSPIDWFKNEYKPTGYIDRLFPRAFGKLFKASLWKHARFTDDESALFKVYLLSNKITYTNEQVFVSRLLSKAETINDDQVLPRPTYVVKEQWLTMFSQITAKYDSDRLKAYKTQLDSERKNGENADIDDATSKVAILKKYNKM